MYNKSFCKPQPPPPPKKKMFYLPIENKSINIIIDSNNHAFYHDWMKSWMQPRVKQSRRLTTKYPIKVFITYCDHGLKWWFGKRGHFPLFESVINADYFDKVFFPCIFLQNRIFLKRTKVLSVLIEILMRVVNTGYNYACKVRKCAKSSSIKVTQ